MQRLHTSLLTLALLLVCSGAQTAWAAPQPKTAPSYTLTGRVVNEQHAPVDYATVTATLLKDSTRLYGAITDEKGDFALSAPAGVYRLGVSFLGYAPYADTVTLKSALRLDTILLKNGGVLLDEVVVKGNLITREADRFVVNLANTPLAIGRDGKEALKLAPGVWISNKGEISVNGRTGTRVMVNDRILRETGDDLIAYLENLKAEDILKIEVVPYAGAEFDANMTAGVIKITLKKQRNDGMEGSVSMRIGSSVVNDKSWYLQPSANLKYRNNKLSLYTNFSLNRYKSGNELNETTAFSSGVPITQNSRGEMINLGTYSSVTVGGVYDLTSKQSVGLEVRYASGPGDSRNDNRMHREEAGELTDVNSLFRTSESNRRLTLSANYILKLDTIGSTFKILVDYNRRDGDDRGNYHSLYSGAVSKDTLYRSDIQTLNNIFSTTADFDILLSKSTKINTGLKYTRNSMDNTTFYESMLDPEWHPIDPLNSVNRYNENISALYLKFSTQFKNKMALSVGLRGEYTYAVPATSSTVITDKQNYFGLFPNANLSMPLNKKGSQMLILGYTRKISRPWFWALNPFRMPLSEFSYVEGNPLLKPSYTNDINLSWVIAHKYNLTFGTSLSKGMIGQVARTDPAQPGMLIYKFENIRDSKYLYLSASLPIQLTKWWRLMVNLNGSHTRSQVEGNEMLIANSLFTNMESTVTLWKEWYWEVSGNYSTPQVWGNLQIGSNYSLNTGIKRTFAKKRFTASLYLNDVLNSNKQRITSTGPGFITTNDMQYSFRRLGFSLRYNFKAGKSVKVKNVESGAGEDAARLGGGK